MARKDVEQPKPGVANPNTGSVETATAYPQLKTSLWSRMGGIFRTGAIGGAVTAGLFGLTTGAAAIASAAPVSLATAQAVSFVAATIATGGIGFVLAGLAAATMGAAAIVRAANPKYREKLNQKALIKRLTKALQKGQKLSLSKDQKDMLNNILKDEKMLKYINKLSKRFNKKNAPLDLLDLLNKVNEFGHTDVLGTPEELPDVDKDKDQDKDKDKDQDKDKDKDQDKDKDKDRQPTNEDIYARILSKNIFTAGLSAREWLALQQIYAAEKKSVKAKVDELEGKENLSTEEQKALAEAQDSLKKLTILERRAYNAARARAGAEAADPNNNISEEQRKSLQDFANKGRRSTEAAKVVTKEDYKTAADARERLDEIVAERKNKPKSSGR